jgi:hypothetical protein
MNLLSEETRRYSVKRRVILAVWATTFVLTPAIGYSQVNACDLAAPLGVVDAADVQAAINMSLGTLPCTANIGGAGVCNVAVVQRVINAALGGSCVTGSGAVPHSATLNWVASTSPNIAGYNVYRATVATGPYTRVNTSLVTPTTYLDPSVQAGVVYYYVVTAVDANSNESGHSNQAQATVPSP